MKQEDGEYVKEIDNYIEKFPEDVQEIMKDIRLLIHKSVPEVT